MQPGAFTLIEYTLLSVTLVILRAPLLPGLGTCAWWTGYRRVAVDWRWSEVVSLKLVTCSICVAKGGHSILQSGPALGGGSQAHHKLQHP